MMFSIVRSLYSLFSDNMLCVECNYRIIWYNLSKTTRPLSCSEYIVVIHSLVSLCRPRLSPLNQLDTSPCCFQTDLSSMGRTWNCNTRQGPLLSLSREKLPSHTQLNLVNPRWKTPSKSNCCLCFCMLSNVGAV